jgi:tripartite motif-containing protein 71
MRLARASLVSIVLIASTAAAQEAGDETKQTLLGFRVTQVFNQHLYFGNFLAPRGLAFDTKNGELWIADTGNGLVSIHRPDGVELYTFRDAKYLRDPHRISAGPGGRYYVIEGSRSVIRIFDYRGAYQGDVNIDVLGEKPVLGAIAVDADGYLYVGENRTGQVFVLTTDGRLRHQFGTRGGGEGQFLSICSIAFGPDKRIYVADQQALAIQVFDYQGNFIRGWGRHEMGGQNVSLPSGMAVDPKGEYVYLADELRHQVKVFTTDGRYLWGVGEMSDDIGMFKYPSDVVVDSRGLMYVAERGGSRVQVFEPVYGVPKAEDDFRR